MSSLQSILLEYVFPSVGVLTGTFMSFAPYRAVLRASRAGTLGDLNPTPWVFMLGNGIGWIAYSFVIVNVYVLLPNIPCALLAVWLNIQAIKLQYENHRSNELQGAIIHALEDMQSKKNLVNKSEVVKIVENVIEDEPSFAEMILDPSSTAPSGTEQLFGQSNTTDMNIDENSVDGITTLHEATDAIVDYASFIWEIAAQKTTAPASHELMVVGICSFWLLLFVYVVFVGDPAARASTIGSVVNVNLVFFYGAPLSNIFSVLDKKSSESIHITTMMTSLVNGTVWFVYGVAVRDIFIATPNGLGASLGAVQLVLCVVFPRRSEYDRIPDSGQVAIHSVKPSTPFV